MDNIFKQRTTYSNEGQHIQTLTHDKNILKKMCDETYKCVDEIDLTYRTKLILIENKIKNGK